MTAAAAACRSAPCRSLMSQLGYRRYMLTARLLSMLLLRLRPLLLLPCRSLMCQLG
jgi:hypothetical protein